MSAWYWPKEQADRMATPATKADLIEAARDNGGLLKIIRFDRGEGKMVEDLITDQMPEDELIL